MSAEFTKGFFVGQAAWHRGGTLFTRENAPKNSKEAIVAGGCDWPVDTGAVFCEDADGTKRLIEGHRCIRRVDTNEILSIVTDSYVPLQNVDAFNFFDGFVTSGDASFEAAGCLQGGRTVWVLAKIECDALEIGRGDNVQPYLVLTMGHGNGRAINVAYTAVRVVCMNTVRWAEQQARDSMISIRHTGDPKRALSVVRDGVKLASRSFEIAAEQARELTQIGCDVKGLEQYVREVLEIESDAKLPRSWERIEAAFENGRGAQLASANGTMWGAYNAVTNWLDHTRGRSVDTRLQSTMFGDSRRTNARAWDVAVAAVN